MSDELERLRRAWEPILEPASERDWMGWPQCGWQRPEFDVPYGRRVMLGEQRFWMQRDAWTAPVEISRDEYETARRTWSPVSDL